jgi:hypothetical protein
MKGILAVADEPLVSVDFRCTDVSTSIDSALTMVMGDDMVKVRGAAGWCLKGIGLRWQQRGSCLRKGVGPAGWTVC